nr:PREDICTED: dynein assembly factor 3, axonemal homolog isoform X2 [Megachile rotundata]
MWWGYSPALDIQFEINKSEINYLDKCLEVLIVGANDARHITKTLASSYLHSDCIITYHVIEPTLEQVARSILLLSIFLERNLGLQEATRYYLEIFGNTLIRPGTAKYLMKHSNQLADIPTNSIDCPWLSLEKFKHKDKDRLESIFKFWRNNGIAFTWLEGELVRSNPTLLSNILQHGPGFIHYTYLGDIVNGPFFAWSLQETKSHHTKYRATDITELEIMRSMHEIRTQEPFCEDLVASHRDSSILNGTLVSEMPSNEMEQELWKKKINKYKGNNLSWIDIKNHKVIFHPATCLEAFKYKTEYVDRFDFIWVAHNMTEQLPNLAKSLKKGGIMLVELKKYLVEAREENLQTFVKELKNLAQKNGLYEINDINAKEHCIAKFCKN